MSLQHPAIKLLNIFYRYLILLGPIYCLNGTRSANAARWLFLEKIREQENCQGKKRAEG